jgi:hypothetical protein
MEGKHMSTIRTRSRLTGAFATAIAVVSTAIGLAAPQQSSAAVTLNTSLDLPLSVVGSGATNGASVTPSIGPTLGVVARGTGSVTAAGTNRYFPQGGQQNSNTAFIGKANPSSALIDGAAGSLTIVSVSRTTLASRTSVAGRNASVLFHVVSRNDNVAASDVAKVNLVTDSGTTPSLVFTVNGTSTTTLLTGPSAAAFNSGVRSTIALNWAAGTATAKLNGTTLATWTIPTTATTWGAGAFLTVGASADYGGGYFSALHDALERITVAAPALAPTNPTLLDLALSSVGAATNGSVVVPTTGPVFNVVVRGTGSVNSGAASNRSFLQGGQQNTNTAFLTTSANPSALVNGTSGSLAIATVSRTALASRTTVAGRNASSLFHVVSRNDNLAASDVVKVLVTSDSATTPTLSLTINGASTTVPLTGANATGFNAGTRSVITLDWSAGTANAKLNGVTVATWTIPTTATTWGPGAALVIGASADYGLGYFSARHDGLERITLSGSGATPPPTTTTTTAVPTTTTTIPSTTTTTVPPITYPAQFDYLPGAVDNQPLPATAADGAPLIRQLRNGVVIATYNKLGGSCSTLVENQQDKPSTECGPFVRQNYTKMRDGDVFEVYPSVYEGLDQQPYFGPTADNYANFLSGIATVKRNITLRGVTVNNKRPVIRLGAVTASNTTLGQALVYVDKSENITIENIDVDGARTGTGTVGKAGIYVVAGANLTLRNMRVHGFRAYDANGIFGADQNSGTLLLDRVQLYDNGGANGPEHNIYINSSIVDPNFTVKMINSYSTDAYFGHLFKSRAQRTILEGNYFRGTTAAPGFPFAESYLVDIPEGGTLIMRNNILVKNASGAGSNGIELAFALESALYEPRVHSLLVEHNTFVTFAGNYDETHPIGPMGFFFPLQTPGTPGFPTSTFTSFAVRNNVFVGFRNDSEIATFTPQFLYRGTNGLNVAFSGLRRDFGLVTPSAVAGSAIVGTPAYGYRAATRSRTTTNIGAVD